MSINYEELNQVLKARASEFLPEWLPGGRFDAKYYNCASIQGGKGDSFKVNLQTGLWGEFNGGDTGKDFIDLYAKIRYVKNSEAAEELQNRYGVVNPASYTPKRITANKIEDIQKPDPKLKPPVMTYYSTEPNSVYCYRDTDGNPIFYIARFDGTKEGKTIIPFSYSTFQRKWVMKGFPSPRPLYGLDLLAKYPEKPVLIVEGEKCKDIAQELFGDTYIAVSWCGGVPGWNKTNWEPLKGRRVLIWPDNDEPGITVARKIAQHLETICPEIKIIDTTGESEKWDVADAVSSGMDFNSVFEWAKPRVKPYERHAGPKQHPTGAEYQAAPRKTEIQVSFEDATDQVPVTRTIFAMWESVGLVLSGKGSPVYSEDNCLRILENEPLFKDFARFDNFHKKIFTDWNDGIRGGRVHEWSDVDMLNLTLYLQRHWSLSKLNYQMVDRGVRIYAMNHQMNSVADWLNNLVWDGKERCEDLAFFGLGCAKTRYSRAVSKNMLIAMAARILNPGCQVDNMVILEGAQGIRKTSALRALGGDYYASCRSQVGSEKFYQAIQAKWLIEIAEMDSFRKSEVSSIKEMLTVPSDRFRVPWDKHAQDFPRQCIFVGTTNESEYLSDTTGARRFWPLACTAIDVEWIIANRDQLFAEAVYRFKLYRTWRAKNLDKHPDEAPENWWLLPKDISQAEQERRRIYDPWEEPINSYLTKRLGECEPERFPGIAMSDVMKILYLPIEKQTKSEQMRIARILRFFGWDKKVVRLEDKTLAKRWFKVSGGPPSLDPEIQEGDLS